MAASVEKRRWPIPKPLIAVLTSSAQTSFGSVMKKAFALAAIWPKKHGEFHIGVFPKQNSFRRMPAVFAGGLQVAFQLNYPTFHRAAKGHVLFSN